MVNKILNLITATACAIAAIVSFTKGDALLGNTSLILAMLFLREYKES